LADEQTPETSDDPQVGPQDSPQDGAQKGPQDAPADAPKKASKRLVWIGAGVGALVVVGVVLFLVLNSRDDDDEGAIVSGPPSVTGFQFNEARAVALITNPKSDQKKANNAIQPVASHVVEQLNTLYGEAFLNPTNWQANSYDTALAVFDNGGGAKAKAQQQLGVLTAGTAAGTTYSSIVKGESRLTIQVLVDGLLKPASAVGNAWFTATAQGKDGSLTTIRSKGEYIFRDLGGTWMIVSFNVTRSDHPATATPTTSVSETPSSSVTP
jgi:hypothetical protein